MKSKTTYTDVYGAIKMLIDQGTQFFPKSWGYGSVETRTLELINYQKITSGPYTWTFRFFSYEGRVNISKMPGKTFTVYYSK
jgi:hypothetical protein